MSTRSFIFAKLSTGQIKSVYCHSDGYPDYNGRLLNEHYTDQTKVDALLALGDLSILGEEIGEKHSFDNKPVDACTAYGRDRGETGTQARIVRNLASAVKKTAESNAEFVYIWDGEAWSVTTPERGIQPLPAILLSVFFAGDVSLVQTVKVFGVGPISKRTVTGK